MFQTKPVGRHNVAICTNVSCMLRGAEEIVEHVEDKLGIKVGESTGDGRIYLKREEECLAACCGAPMMMVESQVLREPDHRTGRRNPGRAGLMAYEQNLVCFTTLGEEKSWTLATYEKHDGYEAWRRILAGEMSPARR